MSSEGTDHSPMAERIDAAENRGGPISGLLYQYSLQIKAIERHGAAEGLSIPYATILDSYDRQNHPWLHGRRPAALVVFCRDLVKSILGEIDD